MNNKPLDKTKKSNIKCEHCKNWEKAAFDCYCTLNGKSKNYWNRCKQFDWIK